MHTLAAFIVFAFLCATAQSLSRKYDRGPFPLKGGKATLHWTLNNDTRRISLALTVTDPEALSETGAAWLALGVSEKTSGSMLGSDIVSGEFGPGLLANCTAADRFVPFSAYPIGESTPNAASVFPNKDSCQTDGSWVLVSCMRNPSNGTATLEVDRALEANDEQDRSIGHGDQAIIFAYGASALAYHGSMRGSTRVVLFNEDGSYPSTGLAPLPSDVSFSQDVLATNFTVPSTVVTTYACTTVKVPLPASGKRTLIAVDPKIQTVSGKIKTHHLLIYACADTEYAKNYTTTSSCIRESPAGSLRAKCQALIFVWAVGSPSFRTPEDVGFEINKDNNYFIMETHYDNPDMEEETVDISGAKLYFADDRPIKAGTLALGDPLVSLFGQPVKNDFEYVSSCPSNCTATWKENINVFMSVLHMHTTGRKIFTNHFDKNGTLIQRLNTIEYWSNDHQYFTSYPKPRVIRPGDKLSTTCIFDTRKRPNKKFGLETTDEMCLDFLFYYPVQRRNGSDSSRFGCHQLFLQNANASITTCGDPLKVSSYNFPLNPTFKDTAGTPDIFGREPGQCSAVSAIPIPEKTEAEKREPDPSLEAAMNPSPAPNLEAEMNPSPAPNLEAEMNPTPVPNPFTSPPPPPSPTPSESESLCFPASALVRTQRGPLPMRDLRVGDEVSVGGGRFSRVFMFTHRVESGLFPFVELRTRSARVSLSASHFIHVSGQLKAAGNVRVGDRLMLVDGVEESVVSANRVLLEGLYNPQTLQGDIAVEGVVASTYTQAVPPGAAHALLAPFRAARIGFPVLESDVGAGARVFRTFARWIFQKS